MSRLCDACDRPATSTFVLGRRGRAQLEVAFCGTAHPARTWVVRGGLEPKDARDVATALRNHVAWERRTG